ncbi:hypothetical protein KJ652_05265 [Patescibacteria group bacterium]|nr:hypothetical protein [Patescibacteria group bacterium]MBU1123973.1 hypothetical protein [Patescibacteria group bacterium]MBU1911828.1 hypothetical protein [Patescibacteria group bacterium]
MNRLPLSTQTPSEDSAPQWSRLIEFRHCCPEDRKSPPQITKIIKSSLYGGNTMVHLGIVTNIGDYIDNTATNDAFVLVLKDRRGAFRWCFELNPPNMSNNVKVTSIDDRARSVHMTLGALIEECHSSCTRVPGIQLELFRDIRRPPTPEDAIRIAGDNIEESLTKIGVTLRGAGLLDPEAKKRVNRHAALNGMFHPSR